MLDKLFMGFLLLIGAVILNVFATSIGLSTWYGYLLDMSTLGFWLATKGVGMFNLVWLYLIYPFALGLLVHYSNLLMELIDLF